MPSQGGQATAKLGHGPFDAIVSEHGDEHRSIESGIMGD
jgi:hypothetical protein